MERSAHSTLGRMMREAHAASAEAEARGMPIDEVTGQRAERSLAKKAMVREALEEYNDSIQRANERGAPQDLTGRDHLANLRAASRGVSRRDVLRGAGIAAAGGLVLGTAGVRPAGAGGRGRTAQDRHHRRRLGGAALRAQTVD